VESGDRRALGFHPVRKKDRSNHHRKCLHATPHQCTWYGILS
jgi:hypothetical protein